MKRILTCLLAGICLTGPAAAQAPHSLEQLLKSIERNNKELQASARQATAQKLEERAANNLPDPTFSYAHLWGAKARSETIGELVVAQSFDFPTLYATRHRLNRLQASAHDSRHEQLRQTILLQAQEVCIDICGMRRQLGLLRERLQQAQALDTLYALRLQTGDANALEVGKTRLELLNARTELALQETELHGKLQELARLNGNQPIAYEYEEIEPLLPPLPDDLQKLTEEVLAADGSLRTLDHERLAAHKLVAVQRTQWLPRLELGYRRNTEAGSAFNGFMAGFSFPLFENRHKVKQAKAQAMAADLRQEDARKQTIARMEQLYAEARMLQASLQTYATATPLQQTPTLLRQALEGGEIGLTEYFAETALWRQSLQNRLELESRYQKVVAQLYKHLL